MRFSICLAFLLASCLPAIGESRVGGDLSPDGHELHLDLPKSLHLKNRGGSDKAGLCVFCSAQHSFNWAHIEHMEHIFEYMWDKPGGGWPEKLTKVIEDMSRKASKPVPPHYHYKGKDQEFLRKAIEAGIMPGITYFHSPTGRYSGRILHMVTLVHLDDRWAGVLDNNYPGEIEWIDARTFQNVWTDGNNGWAFVVLSPGPPPPPSNP